MLNCCEFFKDIGYICGDIKFSLTYAGNWPFLAVAVDNCFHIYSGEELKLIYVSSTHSEKIQHIASEPSYIYTATNSTFRVTNYTKNTYKEVELNEPISSLIVVGSLIVLSVNSVFTVLSSVPFKTDIEDQEEEEAEETFSIDCGCEITTMMHPNGYTNKFLVALSDTTFQLWNTHQKMQIYGFNGFSAIIRQIIQSPDMDVCAFALSDGRLVFHNIKTDVTLFSLQHPSPINDLSFRLDGPPQVAVGLENGSLLIWDLSLRQIITTVPLAHNAAITSVHFLKSSNIVVTGGIDNAIRQWELDQESHDLIRILRSRVGHQFPPVDITFAQVNGVTDIVTCSNYATVISTNPVSETTSSILSTSPLNERHLIHKVHSIASTDSHRFCSLATQHEDGTLVFLWDIENNRFARKAMTAMPINGPNAMMNDQNIPFAAFNGDRVATCTCLTRCGNFGCVGTSEGTVEVFVTQSCRHKGSTEHSHESPVVFVHVDSMNTQVVSGSVDGTLFFHNFDDLSFCHSMNLPAPITHMKPHLNSRLLAIACDDGNKILIIDISSHLIAREFEVPSPETFCFSHDGKFLFVVSQQGEIYLFDMITANLIEKKLSFISKDSQGQSIGRIVGIAADPRGDMIATIHENSVATKLWHFRPNKIKALENMTAITESQQEGLAIFTNEPQLKIKNILNPPKDPLKFAKAKAVVPFFLQQTSAIGDVIKKENEAMEALVKQLHQDISPQTDFVKTMIIEYNEAEPLFEKSIQMLIEMDHEQIGLEISGLRVDEEKEIDERLVFLRMLITRIKTKKDFDMIQVITNVFLNEYGVKILADQAFKQSINELREAQEEAIAFLDRNLSYSQYLVRLINRIQ